MRWTVFTGFDAFVVVIGVTVLVDVESVKEDGTAVVIGLLNAAGSMSDIVNNQPAKRRLVCLGAPAPHEEESSDLFSFCFPKNG